MSKFSIATEVNGILMHLKLPPMARVQAELQAKKLRELAPATPIYVVNTAAEQNQKSRRRPLKDTYGFFVFTLPFTQA